MCKICGSTKWSATLRDNPELTDGDTEFLFSYTLRLTTKHYSNLHITPSVRISVFLPFTETKYGIRFITQSSHNCG